MDSSVASNLCLYPLFHGAKKKHGQVVSKGQAPIHYNGSLYKGMRIHFNRKTLNKSWNLKGSDKIIILTDFIDTRVNLPNYLHIIYPTKRFQELFKDYYTIIYDI